MISKCLEKLLFLPAIILVLVVVTDVDASELALDPKEMAELKAK